MKLLTFVSSSCPGVVTSGWGGSGESWEEEEVRKEILDRVSSLAVCKKLATNFLMSFDSGSDCVKTSTKEIRLSSRDSRSIMPAEEGCRVKRSGCRHREELALSPATDDGGGAAIAGEFVFVCCVRAVLHIACVLPTETTGIGLR